MSNQHAKTGNIRFIDMGRVARLARSRDISRAAHHQYQVGDDVSYDGGQFHALRNARRQPGQSTAFKIVARLPDEGRGFQYRIKNVADGLERIVVEAEVSPLPLL
jgi:hypothetical protein